jgi:hypothetical protein
LIARLTTAIALVVFCGACKSKSAPAPSITDAEASIASTSIIDASAKPQIASDGGPTPHYTTNFAITVVAVSSRVDNGTEAPLSLVDGDLDTAWSSRTGDLVGAWVAFDIVGKVAVHAIKLTVGMTKDPDLFVQNVRVAEVKVSWLPFIGIGPAHGPEVTLVDHVALDVTSRELQKIPIEVGGQGALKITVEKIKMGTKPSWREATISEVEIDDANGALGANPYNVDVGSFDPQPRGVLGIIPERPVPLRCLAASASGARVYCALGSWGTGAAGVKAVALVSLDKDDMNVIEPLFTDDFRSTDPRISYGAWLRVEHDLRNGKTLATGDPKHPLPEIRDIPWGGSIDADGATFRQRQTKLDLNDASAGDPDVYSGVLEVQFPGATTFTKIFDDDDVGTDPFTASIRPVGSSWLVERSISYGAEGIGATTAAAALCDVHAKHCKVSWEPPNVAPER